MEIQTGIARLEQAIWQRRPILGEIMAKHGNKTLHAYSRDFLDVNPSPVLDVRKQEIIEAAGSILQRRLGQEVAAGVMRQLKKLPLVSTADHHATIDSPFWVNSNIVGSLPRDMTDPDLKYLVVFSFASVSLNNASGYPRGIDFHNDAAGDRSITHLPVFPDRMKMGTVYATKPFTGSDVVHAQETVVSLEKNGKLCRERAQGIEEILKTYFMNQDVILSPDLNTQITKINFAMWPKLFHGTKGAETAEAQKNITPDLIYLEIETLVTLLLTRFHLTNRSSLIHSVLFDADWEPLIRKYFADLPGSFAENGEWGTYFFWGLDEKLRRVKLKLVGNTLQSFDGSTQIPWTPEAISSALHSKRIMPNMLLCYLMVAFYYGMKCLGGFCQVHDLTRVKEAWQTMLKERGEFIEAAALEPVQTKELGSAMVLAYVRTTDGGTVPATGIDMIMEKSDTSMKKYVTLSKTITLEEAMSSMLPEMYTVLYAEKERDPALLQITPERILRETGMEKKLTSDVRSLRCG